MKKLCLVLSAVGMMHGQNWPQFRGPAASGATAGTGAPVQWNVEKNERVAWKTLVPGLAVSSPIVWGELVFVTTAISSDPNAKLRHGLYGDVEPSKDLTKHQWKVYALDRKTGKVVWQAVAHEGVPKTKRHPKSSQASCTPVTDGKHVIAHFGSEGLYSYSMQGKLEWKVDLGKLNAGWFFDPDYEWGVASSPIIYKDRVIVQCDRQENSFVAAYSLKDGKQLWRTERDEIPSWATPGILPGAAGRDELVTHATKFIRGYDPMTGKELWRLSGNSEIATPTPVIGHGLAFVTNGYRGIQPIYAIRPGASGDVTLPEGKSTGEYMAWSKKQGGPYTPTPILVGDYLYTCSNNGVLACYQAKTGERVYQERIGKGGAFSASPVASGGRLYLPGEDGEIYVVKAGPQYELLATNPVGEVLMATPAVTSGMLIVRGMQSVIAVR